MKLKKLAAVATMTIAAMGITAGTSYAAPAAPAEDTINYEVRPAGDSVETIIDAGQFQISGDGESVELQDDNGNTVISLPLAIQLGDLQLPFEREISEDGKTLTLTPPTDLSTAVPVAPEDKVGPALTPVALKLSDVASPEENLKSQQNFISQLGMATAIGTVAGAIIGCVIGAIVGVPAAVIGGPIGGCAAGGAAGATIGAFVAGGPTAVIAGIAVVQDLLAPPGTTQWAEGN